MHPIPRACRTLPAPAWTYRYHEGVDELVHPWAGGEVSMGFARLTGDAFFTLSTLGHGPVFSPDMGIVLWLDGTTVLDRQLPSPASSLVVAFDAFGNLTRGRPLLETWTLHRELHQIRRRRWLVVYGGYAAFDSSPPAIMQVVRPDKMSVAV